MLRSFMVSTIALTCPVPSATLLVCDAVPLVSSVIEVVEGVVEARSWQLLNCRNASMSKYLRASSLSVLSRLAFGEHLTMTVRGFGSVVLRSGRRPPRRTPARASRHHELPASLAHRRDGVRAAVLGGDRPLRLDGGTRGSGSA